MGVTGLLVARSGLRTALIVIGIVSSLSATLQSNSVSERVRALSDRIIAPCCWREAVSVHQSPAATNLRQQIQRGMEGGKSDEAILAQLVREHGKRILRVPEGTQGHWLYWIPVAAVCIGLSTVVRLLRRWKSRVLIETDGQFMALADVDMILNED